MSEEHRPAFTEADRAAFYNTIREQTDQPTAEYMTAHLLPAPLTDLVTKNYLSAELSRFADKMNQQHATQRTEDSREYAAQFEEDLDRFEKQRAEDRKTNRNRLAWVIGIWGAALAAALTAQAMIWLKLLGVIG